MPTLKYLDYDGLDYFWDKIDAKKQNKLTAGAGISITGDTISATGGGTADAVDWGHITGSMSNQTDLTNALAAKANSADLAAVATSGDFDDLIDKPTIGNATLTIQKNGTNVQTFTANATSNKTANITVPTKTSDLTNDSNFVADANYVHTDNNYTTTEKNKLAGIAAGAEVNQNAFSNVKVGTTTVAADAKTDTLELVAGSNVTITPDATNDKVTIAATDTTYSDATTSAHGLMSAADKTKLNGIATGAEVNVQSDWSVTDTASDAFIKNKPTIPTVNNGTLTIQKNGTNVQTFTANQSGNATANIVIDELQTKKDTRNSMLPSDVALGNKSTIAFTSMNALDSQTSGGGYADALTLSSWNDASGGRINTIVATKQNDQKLYHYTGTYNGSSWSGKKEIAYADDLSVVATSGSYNDLSNKPTIPTVNNATLTIQKNGTTVKTFTANASSNVTANITVPTKTSDLTNDSGFLASVPTASASTLGGIKVGNNLTISSDGTLSANASSITVDSALSSTSTNPVQNKVINTALNGKQASLSTAQLNAANSGITAAKVSTYDGYASQIADKQNLLSPGSHIDITSDVISATGYVHSENPQASAAASSTITGSMIANGTITADKLASGATVKLTMSTSDIGEGAPLAANTLYGVYI